MNYMRPLFLPLEVWSSVKSLLSTSDSSALSLAGLPGSGRLDLRFHDAIGFSTFLQSSSSHSEDQQCGNPAFRSLEAVKVFQRKLKLPSIKSYESLSADFALENVSEVVLWHLDLMRGSCGHIEPKLVQILEHFPQLQVLEVDLVAVSSQFFDSLNRSQLRELRVDDLRNRSSAQESFSISSDFLQNLTLNVCSTIKLFVHNCTMLKICRISTPFSHQPDYSNLPALQYLSTCSAIVDNVSFLDLKSLLELHINFNNVHFDHSNNSNSNCSAVDLRPLSQLKLLIASNVRTTLKLPKSLEALDVLLRGSDCLGGLKDSLSCNRKILSLAVRVEESKFKKNSEVILQLLQSLKLKRLKALFLSFPNDFSEEQIVEIFPTLQALTLWPRKNKNLIKYSRWIQQYFLTQNFM